jgi:hypothetical protein
MIDIFVDPTYWGGNFIVVANVAHPNLLEQSAYADMIRFGKM